MCPGTGVTVTVRTPRDAGHEVMAKTRKLLKNKSQLESVFGSPPLELLSAPCIAEAPDAPPGLLTTPLEPPSLEKRVNARILSLGGMSDLFAGLSGIVGLPHGSWFKCRLPCRGGQHPVRRPGGFRASCRSYAPHSAA